VSSSLQVVVGLIEILLLDFDLRDLIKGARLEELVIAHPDDLLEVQDRVVEVVQLFQGFGFVEVPLAQGSVGWGHLGLTQLLQCSVETRGFFFFGQLTQTVEIFKGLIIDVHLQVEDASLH
jgi:hypothetical protein